MGYLVAWDEDTRLFRIRDRTTGEEDLAECFVGLCVSHLCQGKDADSVPSFVVAHVRPADPRGPPVPPGSRLVLLALPQVGGNVYLNAGDGFSAPRVLGFHMENAHTEDEATDTLTPGTCRTLTLVPG